MNFRLISKILGFLLLMISGTMLFALFFAVHYGEPSDIKAFIQSIALGSSTGLVLVLFGKNASKDFYRKEGLATVAFAWIFAGILGAMPFYLSGHFPSFTDSLFESISGFTTTGSSILTNIEAMPKGILLWRSLIQWLGGMGIIILFIAIFPVLGIGSKQMYKMEVPGLDKSSFIPEIKHAALILWGIYLGLSALETISLKIAGLSLFDSLCHTFTTMATGGFSTKNASIAHFNSVSVEIIIMFFMVCAGINFTLYFSLLKRNYSNFFKDPEFRVYISIILFSTAFVTINLMTGTKGLGFFESLRYSSFQVISLQTTTGFASANFNLWPAFSKVLLVTLMIVGGCTGSTGGGTKVMRFMLLAKHAYIEILRFIRPNLVKVLKVKNTVIEDDTKNALFGFYSVFIFSFLIATLIMAALGLDIITAATAVLATMWNIGPGLGKVGAVENFAFIPALGKYVLSFCMILGRLEIYTLLAIFIPRFWRE